MAAYQSALFAEWRSAPGSTDVQMPDVYSAEPSDDTVLCRDKDGVPTARYGDDVWDFGAYTFGLKGAFPFKMKPALGDDNWSLNCNREFKLLIYNYIYFAEGGRLGRLALGTMRSHHRIMFNVAKFIQAAQLNDLVSGTTLFECLGNVAYMRAFNDGLKHQDKKSLQSVLSRLVQLGESRLGFDAVSKTQIPYKRETSIGHPVIPLRIYLGRIRDLDEVIEHVYPYRENLREFICDLKHPLAGLSKKNQRDKTCAGMMYEEYRGQTQPDLAELVEKNELGDLFIGNYSIASRLDVTTVLIAIQAYMKEALHLYSGMREQEAAQILTGSICNEPISDGIRNDEGDEVVPERVVQLIATTTKFSGYSKKVKWIACDAVVRAIEICEAIAEGIWFHHDASSDGKPLFVSPAKLRKRYLAPAITGFTMRDRSNRPLKSYVIGESDRDELKVTFTNPLWETKGKFQIGKEWSFTTHQYRRSLAFYASNSGLVNGASLTKQFKHLTRQMRMYYQRSFSRVKTIFGYYDVKRGAYKIPESHIISEFQICQPIHIVNQLMADITGAEEAVFGGTGSFMAKQRERIENGPHVLDQVRAETKKQVKDGMVSYKESPAGGCTKVGPCQDNMMGNVTACLTCPDASLKPSKVEHTLSFLRQESASYEEETPEKIMVDDEIKQFEGFLKKKAAKQ